LFNTFSNGGHPEQVTADLGKRWELEQIALRLWPSASSIQGMNTALFDAIEERPFKLKDVKRAHIRLPSTVFNLHGKLAKYKAKFDALISAHYTAAVVIEDHALTLDQFTPARYDDPVLREAAANLIDIVADDALTDVQAVVEFELNDGSKIVKRCNSPRGSADNRLTRAQIEGKMRAYAQKRIGKAAIERLIASIWALEDVGSIRDLTQSMRREVRAAA
jgi:2-methylcitrate dehydratase PrpD